MLGPTAIERSSANQGISMANGGRWPRINTGTGVEAAWKDGMLLSWKLLAVGGSGDAESCNGGEVR